MSAMQPFSANPMATVSPEDFARGLAQRASTELAGGIAGGMDILRLEKHGVWSYGQDHSQVEDGSLWAINPLSLAHGYCSWSDSQLAGESMVSMSAPLPDLDALGPPPGEEWATQYAAQLRCMSGREKGMEVMYKSTSLGAKDLMRTLVPLISQRMMAGQPSVPVGVLETTSYRHKQWGTIFKPVFRVVEWVDMDAVPADSSPVADDEAAPSRKRNR